MALLKLGMIDKKLIPMILGSLSCFLNRLLNRYKDSLLFKNPILTNISISSSKIFAIIPLIVTKLRSKQIQHHKNEKGNINNSLEYIYTNEKELITRGRWKYIILSIIVFFFNQLFFVLTIKVRSNTTILNILITSIFCYIFFKIKLYRHHYLSIILIVITGLVTDLILENLQYDLSNNLGLFFIRLLRETIYSLTSVIDKYIMETKFVSVYELLLYHGISHVILFILFAIIDYNYFHIDDYEEYFSKFNTMELLVLFGVLITQFGINLSILMTNRDNTPCHVFIIFVFGQLAYYINFSGTSIIVIFCLILILFFSLIFNEIIEINCFGLSINTKRNIRLRANKENVVEMIISKVDSYDYDYFSEGNDGRFSKDSQSSSFNCEECSETYN